MAVVVLPEMSSCQFELLNRQSTFMPATPSRPLVWSLAHCRGSESQDKTADAKQQMHAWGAPRLVRHSNCPAAQHYLGLQGTYRPGRQGRAFPDADDDTVPSSAGRRLLELQDAVRPYHTRPPKLPNSIRRAVDGRRRVQCSIGCPRPLDWSMAGSLSLLGRTGCSSAAVPLQDEVGAVGRRRPSIVPHANQRRRKRCRRATWHATNLLSRGQRLPVGSCPRTGANCPMSRHNRKQPRDTILEVLTRSYCAQRRCL